VGSGSDVNVGDSAGNVEGDNDSDNDNENKNENRNETKTSLAVWMDDDSEDEDESWKMDKGQWIQYNNMCWQGVG